MYTIKIINCYVSYVILHCIRRLQNWCSVVDHIVVSIYNIKSHNGTVLNVSWKSYFDRNHTLCKITESEKTYPESILNDS